MEKIKRVELEKICNTGDLLLYHSSYCTSRIIEFFTHSELSHIAIILKNPTYIDKKLKGLYILESGIEKYPDSIENKKKIGVQIYPLDYVFDEYSNLKNTYIYYRKLTCNRQNRTFNEIIKNSYNKIKDASYDLVLSDWIKAEFEIDIGNIQKKNTFWCSALVAYIYVQLSFLDKKIPWTLIKPSAFFSIEGKQFNFKNCVLEKELLVDFKLP